MTTKPQRVLALEEAARLTDGDRNADYGPPIINLEASADLKATMRRHMVRPLSGAELEALDMVLTKIGRIITGPKPKRDNYVDGAAYMAIAWEAAKDAMDAADIMGQKVDKLFHPTGGVVWMDPPQADDERPSDT